MKVSGLTRNLPVRGEDVEEDHLTEKPISYGVVAWSAPTK